MLAYTIRRLLLIVPTIWAIITVNFFIVQAAPGGPVDQAIARMQGVVSMGVTGANDDLGAPAQGTRASRGLDPQIISQIEAQFGFDRPMHERYFDMLLDYALLDFGDSLFKANSVTGLIVDRLPVSISLGLWSTLIIYLVSIPLGIRKAVRHHSQFDIWTSWVIVIGNAIPGFLFAILLIIVFAGGSYLDWFPLRGLVSDNFSELSFGGKLADYFWHLTLPITALVISGFATLTMLTKNSFLDEINKQYVMTARAKGASEKRVLYKHVFRNAMLIIIAGFPATFISMFFTGSLLIEVIFSLEGLGLLGYEAIVQRDYPVMFGTLYMFGLLGLLIGIVSDLAYTWVDPRIDFESR
ncbi:microcin C ABC transporter permease YejB [Gilvimarinus xylanilyticus]|uniref:Inner membrane ABC transporter permease protein YejB n=1 Tax=Gilvimarinus xylanilyticus TaxID=2944139 RepID=A0A9X2KW06_9GAMM|nr:microcin C ABC transporter permease YejB [Gilvimarinus xylanilyticus]MCP8898530.1 microcin C ABC transporter permease YejB [Gilvimarinus xylanilyticus]